MACNLICCYFIVLILILLADSIGVEDLLLALICPAAWSSKNLVVYLALLALKSAGIGRLVA